MEENEDFAVVLDYLRENCLAGEDEVVDGTDLPFEVVSEHFSKAQRIVNDKLFSGEISDPHTINVINSFRDWARQQRQ